jgi:hypothetical protein
MKGTSIVIAIAIVLSLLAAPALAGGDADKVAAEAAFLKGKDLIKDGKVEEACDQFARSQKLDPQQGTQYNLALCYEKAGRLASAWLIFRELAQRDANAGRKKDSDKHATALGPDLTKMLINVDFAAVPGLVVVRNGEDVTATVGIESPVDPGNYTITATADGHKPFTAEVSATGKGMTVTVAIPQLEKLPPADVGDEVADDATLPPPPDDRPDDPPPPPRRSGSKRRLIGLIVGGVGVAATAAGLGVGAMARGKWSDARAICGDDLACDSQADLDASNALADDARGLGNLSTVLVGAGAAAILGGLVLVLTAPSRSDDGAERAPETALRIVPTITPDGAFVSVGGSL